ncbi:von Willebrand factor type A domain-containing protein [Candidatus Uabimicrobium sp. HlEnr_7]|uniref:vWA domain-containing protein n=1 Tax=Candidatus Uabimicrobium helgolandensis TaxID=3095367 RepID=UPI003557C761
MKKLFIITALALLIISLQAQTDRKIEIDITGDFPEGERIDPQIVSFNGKDVRDNIFLPREYELSIEQPGYLPIKRMIVVPPGEEPFLVSEVLTTKQRKAKINISYDITPTEKNKNYKITLQQFESDKITTITGGMLIKPNSYYLSITQQGYQPIKRKLHVWPDEYSMTIEQKLISRHVPLSIKIHGKVDTKKLFVSVQKPNTNFRLALSDQDSLKPGNYQLEVYHPGYTTIKRNINIHPQEEEYLINQKLELGNDETTSQLLFVSKDKNNVIETPLSITVNNKDISTQKFTPGQELLVVAKYKNFATFKHKIKFAKTGPLRVPLSLLKLKSYQFSIRKKSKILDGIDYPYTFHTDGKQIEDHLIQIEKGIGRYYFTIWLPPKANALKIVAGYFADTRHLNRFRSGMSIGRIDKIEIPHLIEHLERVSTNSDQGRRASLKVLNKMMKSYRSRKSFASSRNIEPLINYIESYRLNSPSDRQNLQAISDRLSNVKNRPNKVKSNHYSKLLNLKLKNEQNNFVPPNIHTIGEGNPFAKYAQQEENREGYSHIEENEFKSTLDDPLSTFSVDVDTASYSNARRFINSAQLPPKDSIRIEECINYFDYDYQQPQDEHPFSTTIEMSSVPWNPKRWLLHVGLQGKIIKKDNIPPCNLVFLIDVSGSMSIYNKLPLLKSALKMLTKQLRQEDNVSIVVYAGAAGLVLEPTNDRKKIMAAIDKLEAGGSTNGGQGIQLAYKIAKQNFLKKGSNRVILATDGDFNVGTTSDGALVRMIEEKRKSGIFLSVLGFGMGNYQDAKMEQLADKGNGNFSYIDNISEAHKVLVEELQGTLVTIAKDVKIQIEFNPKYVQSYRLIGYENRKLTKQDFKNDKKDAGEIGAGHSVTALYEIIPVQGKATSKTKLKYQDHSLSESANSDELLTLKLRYKKPDSDKSILRTFPTKFNKLALDKTSHNFRWSAAVYAWVQMLRESKFKGNLTYEQILTLAKAARGSDENGYRHEFLRLVKLTKELAK